MMKNFHVYKYNLQSLHTRNGQKLWNISKIPWPTCTQKPSIKHKIIFLLAKL